MSFDINNTSICLQSYKGGNYKAPTSKIDMQEEQDLVQP
jgi:hypothetical protein